MGVLVSADSNGFMGRQVRPISVKTRYSLVSADFKGLMRSVAVHVSGAVFVSVENKGVTGRRVEVAEGDARIGAGRTREALRKVRGSWRPGRVPRLMPEFTMTVSRS